MATGVALRVGSISLTVVLKTTRGGTDSSCLVVGAIAVVVDVFALKGSRHLGGGGGERTFGLACMCVCVCVYVCVCVCMYVCVILKGD